jgi:hypothetical protein
MKMTRRKKIAKYAQMCSREGHEEYMGYTEGQLAYYYKDILSEMIDKFDWIEVMATDTWYRKLIRKWKYSK